MTVEIICIVVAIVSIAFAVTFYIQLWKWARQCQNARIAIAYKRRVVLQGPLIEWLLWCNNLDKDHAASGWKVYQGGNVSVAITKSDRPTKVLPAILRVLRSRRPNSVPTSPAPSAVGPQVKTGTWTAKDETVKQPTNRH